MLRYMVFVLIEEALVELGHIEYGEISEELSFDDLGVDEEERLYLVSELNEAFFVSSYYCISWVNLFRFHKVKDLLGEVMNMMN